MRGLGRDGAAQILRRARDGGATTSMDILSEGSPKLLAILKPCLPFVDWFMPNAEQACKLTESSSAEQAAIQLLLFGVGGVVLTMGGDGSLLTTARDAFILRPMILTSSIRRDAVTRIAQASSARCRLGWPPAECMKLGNAAAALVAQGLGSDAGIRDLDDTLRFMRETPLRPS